MTDKKPGYQRIDEYDAESVDIIANQYLTVLKEIGENPDREGLLKTPKRVAKALKYLTHGYDLDPSKILKSALFQEDYKQN